MAETKNSNFKEYVYPVIILTVIAMVAPASSNRERFRLPMRQE